tara:strand:- start:5175 stop:5711 length:537 start_codon:yes stop_codon:yes gene_type:complete
MPGESKDKELKIAQYKTNVYVDNSGLANSKFINHYDFRLGNEPETTLNVDIKSNTRYITNLEGLSRISMVIPIEFTKNDFQSKGIYNFTCQCLFSSSKDGNIQNESQDIKIDYRDINIPCNNDLINNTISCFIKVESPYFEAQKDLFYRFELLNFKINSISKQGFNAPYSRYLIENYS